MHKRVHCPNNLLEPLPKREKASLPHPAEVLLVRPQRRFHLLQRLLGLSWDLPPADLPARSLPM
eukprot:183136-Hanusia_phi.AAC.1